MLLTLLFSLFSHGSALKGESLLLPSELVDVIAEDYELKTKPEVVFSRKPLTVQVWATNEQHTVVFDAQHESLDFADFGPHMKTFQLSIDASWFPEPKPPAPEKPAEKPPEEVKEAEAEHGSEHGGGGHGGGGHEEKTAIGGDLKKAAGPIKTLYFINRYRPVKSKNGEERGLPCGKVVRIQSHLDEVLTPKGIKVVTAGGRHIDMFGGDFVLVYLDGEELLAAHFRLKDSRLSKRLCKMSFE